MNENNWDKANTVKQENNDGYEVDTGEPKETAENALNEYNKQQNKMRRQDMKLHCLGLAVQGGMGTSYDAEGKLIGDYSKVLEAAKAYYQFVRA